MLNDFKITFKKNILEDYDDNCNDCQEYKIILRRYCYYKIQKMFLCLIVIHIFILITNIIFFQKNNNEQVMQFFIYSDTFIIIIFIIMTILVYKFYLKFLIAWDGIICSISFLCLLLITELQFKVFTTQKAENDNTNVNDSSCMLASMITMITYFILFKFMIDRLIFKCTSIIIEIIYLFIRIDPDNYIIYPRLIQIFLILMIFLVLKNQERKHLSEIHANSINHEKLWKYVLNIIPNNLMILSPTRNIIYCNQSFNKLLSKKTVNGHKIDIFKWKKLKIRPGGIPTLQLVYDMVEKSLQKQGILVTEPKINHSNLCNANNEQYDRGSFKTNEEYQEKYNVISPKSIVESRDNINHENFKEKITPFPQLNEATKIGINQNLGNDNIDLKNSLVEKSYFRSFKKNLSFLGRSQEIIGFENVQHTDRMRRSSFRKYRSLSFEGRTKTGSDGIKIKIEQVKPSPLPPKPLSLDPIQLHYFQKGKNYDKLSNPKINETMSAMKESLENSLEIDFLTILDFLLISFVNTKNTGFFFSEAFVLDYEMLVENSEISNDEIVENRSSSTNLNIHNTHNNNLFTSDEEDCTRYQFELKIQIIDFQNEPAVLLILNDLTYQHLLTTLQEKNQYKTMLLSTFSHELRTPLNCSICMISSALEDINVDIKHKDKLLRPAYNSCIILESILDDMLDFSLINSKKFSLTMVRFNLVKFLNDIVNLFIIQSKEKQLQLGYKIDNNVPLDITSDQKRIKQLLINFLVNSLKFTIKGKITIHVSLDQTSNLLKFSVIDTGVGIDPQSLIILKSNIKRNQNVKISPYSAGLGFGLRIAYLISKYLCPNIKKYMNIQSSFNVGTEVSFFIETWHHNNIDGFDEIKMKFIANTIVLEESPSERYDNQIEDELVCSKHKEENKHIMAKSSFNENTKSMIDKNQGSPFIPLEKLDGFKKGEKENCSSEFDEKIHFNLNPSIVKSLVETRFNNYTDIEDIQNPENFNPLALENQHYESLLEKYPKKYNFGEVCGSGGGLGFTHIDIDKPLSHKNETIMLPETLKSAESPLNQLLCKCQDILIVDDDMFNLMSLKALLTQLGEKSIIMAYNGKLAIEKVHQKLAEKCSNNCKCFKIIFMDLNMPEMDGLEATKILKQHMQKNLIPNTPIIACTADNNPATKEKCIEHGMDEFIQKPVKYGQLQKIFRNFGLFSN